MWAEGYGHLVFDGSQEVFVGVEFDFDGREGAVFLGLVSCHFDIVEALCVEFRLEVGLAVEVVDVLDEAGLDLAGRPVADRTVTERR